MSQKNNVHGISRAEFFRHVVMSAAEKGMSPGIAREWLAFFDEEQLRDVKNVAAETIANKEAPKYDSHNAAAELAKTTVGSKSTLLAQKVSEAMTYGFDVGYTVHGLNLRALAYRLGAVWFNGLISWPQLEAVAMLTVIYGFQGTYVPSNTRNQRVAIPRLSYILATIYHETAGTMQPIEECGKGKGHPYGDIDPETHVAYYGRGYVQLTWRKNYEIAQEMIGPLHVGQDLNLVWEPDGALLPFYAMQIAVRGMEGGWFTGRCLGDYLTQNKTDYVNARRVINGTDQAERIAAYALEAEEAIRHAFGQPINRALVMGGSRGADVRELQLMLELDPDGIAGDKTVAAIMDFQSKHSLVVDGKCGVNTWNALDLYCYDIDVDRQQQAASATNNGMDSKWEA